MSEEKFDKKILWQMKKDDLIQLGADEGIDFDPDSYSRKDLIERLLMKFAEEGRLSGPVEIGEEGNEIKLGKRYVDIVFHNTDGGGKYQFLGHNGRSLYLPRECVCRIPEEFMNVVKSAVEIKLKSFRNPDGTQTWKEIRVPRLSYEVIDRGVM